MREFIPKKQQEKEVISIRIASDLLADLDNVALRYEISRNELIVQCLEYALADIPAAPENDTGTPLLPKNQPGKTPGASAPQKQKTKD